MNILFHQTTRSINNLTNKINKRKNEKNDIVMYHNIHSEKTASKANHKPTVAPPAKLVIPL